MIRRRKINLYRGEFLDILNLVLSKELDSKNYVKEFEEKFADYIGTKHAIATCTGRNAMMLLLDALNFKKGDEIIFPAYTLKDIIILVQNKGLKPVLVDIEKNSFNINPDLIKTKISSKTKAIVPTHMFGLSCNMKKIIKIADDYNINVIEDCCIAHGAEFEGKKAGSFGIGGVFSFNQVKLIGTFEGGMITTNNDKIANFIRKKTEEMPYPKKEILKRVCLSYLENFILKSPLFYLFAGLFYFKPTKELFNRSYMSYSKKTRIINSKYTNLQAFIGLKQIDKLDEKINKRIKNAKLLKKLLDKKIKTQKIDRKCKHAYHCFVVKFDKDSQKIQRSLLKKGLDVGIKEEIEDDCTIILNEFSDDCSITHNVFNTILQIPIYESLTKENIHHIANVLNEELTPK